MLCWRNSRSPAALMPASTRLAVPRFIFAARSTLAGATPSLSASCTPRSRSSALRPRLSSVAIMASTASAAPASSHTSAWHSPTLPAARMARQRRSPSTMRKRSPARTTTMGFKGSLGNTKFVSKPAAISARSANSSRGLLGSGSTSASGTAS